MSVEALSWALNQAPVEDAGAASVLVGLANHAGPDGRECWPSVERLAYYTRMSERTVRRHLRALEELGVIVQDDDTRGRDAKTRADQRPNAYRLVMDGPTRESFQTRRDRERAERHTADGGSDCHPVEGTAKEAGTKVTGGQNDRPDNLTGGTNTTARGANLTPEPSVEPPPTNSPSESSGNTTQTAIDGLPEPPAKTKRRQRVPADWEPSEALCTWTRETAPGIPRSEVEQFRDHHVAKGSLFDDIDAAWRTWVRNWKKREGTRRPGRPAPYRNPQSHQQDQLGTTGGPPASDGWDDYLNPGGQH